MACPVKLDFLIRQQSARQSRGDLGGVGDTHDRRSIERRAVGVEWRPVHNGVAGSASPGGVPASAVTEAGDMPNKNLSRAEWVPVRATLGPVGDPLPGRGLHQLAQHTGELTTGQ